MAFFLFLEVLSSLPWARVGVLITLTALIVNVVGLSKKWDSLRNKGSCIAKSVLKSIWLHPAQSVTYESRRLVSWDHDGIE